MQYYWNAAQGYRFQPWKSPYMRWRLRLFLERSSQSDRGKFFHLAWKYREHNGTFVDWPRKTPLSTPAPRLKPEHIPSTSLNDRAHLSAGGIMLPEGGSWKS